MKDNNNNNNCLKSNIQCIEIRVQWTVHLIQYLQYAICNMQYAICNMQDKSTMSIYRKFKHTIRDEQDLYANTASSVTLFRVRTGTLKLNWERRHTDGHTICVLCKMNLLEDLHYFLIECTAITHQKKTY